MDMFAIRASAKRCLSVVLALYLSSFAVAGKKKNESDPIMPEVTARGRTLYEYDEAAWHATDAVQATHPPSETVGRYIANQSGSGWTVVFGHLNEKRDAFVIGYEAVQGASLEQFSVKKIDPPREETSFYLAAARAIDTALHDFHGENRPYNVAVLPASPNGLYVYVMPAQTKPDTYPLGGDVRYLITADGSAVVEKRQLHKTILDISQSSLPKGTTPSAAFHTHVLSDVPEDTDVFHVLTRKPPQPEFIGTMDKKLYEIAVDGNIYYRGKL
jgi:hypothetical protein